MPGNTICYDIPLPAEQPGVTAESIPLTVEASLPPYVERAVNLDEVDFAPLLAMVEKLIPEVRRLAEWADDGEVGDWVRDPVTNEPIADVCGGELRRDGDFGETGFTLLQRVADHWLSLESALTDNGLWAIPASWEWRDRRRYVAVRCLRDLADTAFCHFDWIEQWRPRDADDPRAGDSEADPIPLTLGPGSRMGLPHTAALKRLEVAARLLREIVSADAPHQPRMTVEEAQRKAAELTNTPGKKKRFFEQSERKQAELIGCSWATWSKTQLYSDAVSEGWLQKRKSSSNSPSGSRPSVRSLSVALEAAVGEGERDVILEQLAEAESGEPKNRWEDLPTEERLALLAEHDADNASDPSPLDPTRKKVRDSKRL